VAAREQVVLLGIPDETSGRDVTAPGCAATLGVVRPFDPPAAPMATGGQWPLVVTIN